MAQVERKKNSKRDPVRDSSAKTVYRDHNPYWSSSLFNEVYLRNDVPIRYSKLWESATDFEKFQNEFHNFVLEQRVEDVHSWSESDTIDNWIIPVMEMLGWHDRCEGRQNPYLKELSLSVPEGKKKKVFRFDLAYVGEPKFKQYIAGQSDSEDRLREARNDHTGIQMVLEAKYWDRLEHSRQDQSYQDQVEDKRRANVDSGEGARALAPEDQILKYLDIVQKDFGILTDGKTWRLYHREMSKGDVRRNFEFDLGNLADLVRGGIDSEDRRSAYLREAKYFYFIFRKQSLVQTGSAAPFVFEILTYSKKYTSEVEEDLKQRFIYAMGLACNALKRSSMERNGALDLESIRSTAESHLFNILFIRSCETRKILPLHAPDYLKVSLTEVIESLDHMRFDPDKDIEDFEKFYSLAFGQTFKLTGFDLYDRLLNLYEVVQQGNAGFSVCGFKESIFSRDEWSFAKKNKIDNRSMIELLFTLNFTKSTLGERKHQQIPYNIFTPRQLGSIYESFLDFRVERAETDMVFHGGQWKSAKLDSKAAKEKIKSAKNVVKKGDLFFSPNNEDRKITGSFYTPHSVVEYIVANCLYTLCQSKNSKEILRLKVCDPAMGSGHFLNAMLIYLTNVYREKLTEELLDDLKEPFELSARSVLDSCIYGVDINPRAIKLAKMSLWLVTAFPGKKLENLDDQLRIGDSVSPSFNWHKEFPKVFRDEGFDCATGNPPYISCSRIPSEKRDEYRSGCRTAHGAFDIFVLFLEKSLDILRTNGVYGFIVSNKLEIADYAQKCRELLLQESRVEKLIDFTKSRKIFPDASVVPLIIQGTKTVLKNASVFVDTPAINEVPDSNLPIVLKEHPWTDILGEESRFELFKDDLAIKIYEMIDRYPTLKQSEGFVLRTGIMGFEYWSHEPFVREKTTKSSGGWRISTPGLIGKFLSKWGDVQLKIYKKKFNKPLMITSNSILNSNTRRLFDSPKVLIRGVGKGVAAFYDSKGEYAPMVAVHCIDQPAFPNFSTALFNSLLVDWIYVTKFLAGKIPQGSLKYPISFIESIPIKRNGLPALEKKLSKVLSTSWPDEDTMNRLLLEHYEIPDSMWSDMAAKVAETLKSRAVDDQSNEEAV